MKTLCIATTKYLGPTNTRGGRVKARCESTGKTATLVWDHALDASANHARVAALVLGGEPEFCASLDGGYMFGIDEAGRADVIDRRESDESAMSDLVSFADGHFMHVKVG